VCLGRRLQHRCSPQLRVHIGAALNVGLTPEEVEEVILQTVPYAGFPTAINGLTLLRQVLDGKEAEARRGQAGDEGR